MERGEYRPVIPVADRGEGRDQEAIEFAIERSDEDAVLFGFGCGNPLVESCLELPQRRNALEFFITRGRFPLRTGCRCKTIG